MKSVTKNIRSCWSDDELHFLTQTVDYLCEGLLINTNWITLIIFHHAFPCMMYVKKFPLASRMVENARLQIACIHYHQRRKSTLCVWFINDARWWGLKFFAYTEGDFSACECIFFQTMRIHEKKRAGIHNEVGKFSVILSRGGNQRILHCLGEKFESLKSVKKTNFFLF